LVDGIRSEHDEASLYDCLMFLRGSLRSILGRELGKAGAHANEGHVAACVQYHRAPWVGTKRIDRFPIREIVLGRNERPRSDELILERFLLTDCATWHEGEAQCRNCRDTEHVTPMHHIPPFTLMCAHCGVQLSPRNELPEQERKGEEAAYKQAVSDTFLASPACRNLCVLQRDTAQDQHTRVEPVVSRRAGNWDCPSGSHLCG